MQQPWADICQAMHCDALCDPCEAGCNSCHGSCDIAFAGPALSAPRCDATPISGGASTMNRWEIQFEPPSQAPSWLLSVYGQNIQDLVGVTLQLPDGQALNLDTYDHFNLHQQNISPEMLNLLMPSAPDHRNQVQSGTYTLTVDVAGSERPCWRLTAQLPDQPEWPYRLLVRIFGVGPSLGTRAQMKQNSLLREALVYAQTFLAEASIALYVREWVAPPEAIRNEYAQVANVAEGRELLSKLPKPISPGDLDALAVDVAFVDHFSVESMLTGIAGGLPGPVGLHGMSASGVVLSTGLLDGYLGAKQVGIVLAHELGHYLGLRHTSSWPDHRVDPLDDTPECSKSVFEDKSFQCPDAQNFMFPLLSVGDPHRWSADQVAVMHAHPAVTQRTE